MSPLSSNGRWPDRWAKTLAVPLIVGLCSPALAPLGAVLGTTSVAQAQKSGDIGEKMFYEGLTKMKAGKYDEACPLLDEAFRSDNRPASLFYFAECEKGAGRTSSALGLYKDYVALVAGLKGLIKTREKNRDDEAKAAIKVLEEDVPQLTLTLPKDAPKGTVVTRDGVQVQEEVFGVSVQMDPGIHTILVETPNGDKKEQKLKLDKSDRKKIEVQLPKAADDEEEDAAAAKKKKKKKKKKGEPAEDSDDEPKPAVKVDSSSKTLPYVVIGAGGVVTVVGGVFGLLAMGEKSTVDKECKGLKCTSKGLTAVDSAKSKALFSTIGVGVGLVGVGVGVALLVMSPSAPKKPEPSMDEAFIRPFVGPGENGGTLFGAHGRF